MANNANTEIYDRAVDRAAMIRLYEKRVGKKVEEIIDGHKVTVVDLIKLSKLEGKRGEKFRKDLDEEILKTYSNINTVTKRSLLDLALDQLTYVTNNIKDSIGSIWKVQRPVHRVAEDIVLNRPLYNDITLANGWGKAATAEKKRLEAIIRKGIADGLSEEDLAKVVRKSAAFDISKFQALGLVRTAITSVYTQTDYEVYKANEKALQGWQYVAVLDSRTTPLCASRDGHIYPISDTKHLPPAHFNCRSTTVPIVKSYDQLGELEGISQIRKRNFEELTPKQRAFYDGQSPLKESYDEWLRRQPTEIQLRHIGDLDKVRLYQENKLTIDKFNDNGRSVGIKELRQLTDEVTPVNDTQRFALAKQKLDAIKLGAARPDEFFDDVKLRNALKEYYKLQSAELDGILSYTNYRGQLLHTKKATRQRVLNSPPSEDNLVFNPLTNRYEDNRMYQPSPATLENTYRLVRESTVLKDKDKDFIISFVDGLTDEMSMNERAVITENLRIVFGRFRENKEPWTNLKAVLQGQIRYDVMNVSEYMETQIRKDKDLLKRLAQHDFIDPVLGPVQLQDLHDNFIDNIQKKNRWEEKVAPSIAKQLRSALDLSIPFKIRTRLEDYDVEGFYLRLAHRLGLADTPDRDQLAADIGRDLYNSANWRGSRNEWYNLGLKVLDRAEEKGLIKYNTFGVQKRRMKSRLSGQYFGPYYDTFSVNIEIADKRIAEYAQLSRKVDVGLRLAILNDDNRLRIRKGYKTYFDKWNRDTRIPITSTHSFSDFPVELIDDDMTDALNWAATAKYKVDKDFYDFTQKLLNFRDDKGKAEFYDNLNLYRKHMVSRGDAYERLKAMEWLRGKDAVFSNLPFLDHRARIYDRGMISPQSGEIYRPFLSTAHKRNFSEYDFLNLQDQIGGFVGGISDALEGNFSSLSFLGRQKIAEKWRNDLISIGDHMRRGKPNDIRKILENEFLAMIDGDEQGKVFRFALEMSKINEHLGGDFSKKNLAKLNSYVTDLALEQDASSSGAQIIALTTRNKQLASLSNVIPTDQKKRLYDEIAAATFNDPRFKEVNKRVGITEKDLRKAIKYQNMVTLYGAGERTGILQVEQWLSKPLSKQQGILVVKASERDKVLSEISAKMARYEKWDTTKYEELKTLRQDVKDIFNKGLDPGDDIMEQLWFLDADNRAVVEKMTRQYQRVVTPKDFQEIAKISSEYLREQTPILNDFTRFLGRLAEQYVSNAKPKEADLDVNEIIKRMALGEYKSGKRLPKLISQILGIKDEPLRDKLLRRIPGWVPGGPLEQILFGVKPPPTRRTGFKVGKFSLFSEDILNGAEVFYANKLPKNWTNIPWINFDSKIVEQNFTQVFEERLSYKDKDGNWVTNILQVPQKTQPNLWEEWRDKDNKFNSIVDASRARTAFAVNGNHSNDAVLVKRFHLWGKKNEVPTSTVHDAFFTNAVDMKEARKALRNLYAEVLKSNSIKNTLDEMLARGLPKEIYNKYLNEAIDIGLIPVPGRSRVGNRVLTEDDILKVEDILKHTPDDFKSNYGWYGVG